MALSYQKRRLMKQAINNYHKAKAWDKIDWHTELRSLMQRNGWKVSHPGSDKWAAIKGPLVVKWSGRCGWSYTPIQWEMKVYRVLRKLGLEKHIPKVYFYQKHFIIEQNLGKDTIEFQKVDNAVDEFDQMLYNLGYEIIDCRVGNVRLIGDTLKIFDGRIEKIPERKAA